MKKLKKSKQNRQEIAAAIMLTWDSLVSHLPDTAENPNRHDLVGDRDFHARCCREYAYVIQTLANQL